MIKEFDVIIPPNQGELMKVLNATKVGSAVVELVVAQAGDEFSKRKAKQQGTVEQEYSLSVDSINDLNGTPFVLGHLVDDEHSMARLEVVKTAEGNDNERPLHLVIASDQ